MEHTEFARLAPALRQEAKAVGRDFFKEEEPAEDVAQETMIRLWKAWPSLPSPEDAERLAVRIAKHECINVWRREQRRPHTSLSIIREEAHAAAGDEHSLEEADLKEAISKATRTLRHSEGRFWRMFAEAGMEANEIAAATGTNVRTVSSMLSHARKHIYNLLKEGGYIDG